MYCLSRTVHHSQFGFLMMSGQTRQKKGVRNMTDDRRIYPRLPFEYAVQLQDISGNTTPLLRNSFSKNISEIGLKIVSFDFYPVEDKVHLKLFSPHCVCVLDVIGKIVWVQQYPHQEKYMLGLRFLELSEAGHKKVLQLLSVGRNNPQSAQQHNN